MVGDFSLGVNLRDIITKTLVKLDYFSGKTLAIDAYNSLYQFLASIRRYDGTSLTDQNSQITSHLIGLFYRTCNLLEIGIKPIYVFDGVPPTLKEREIKRRIQVKHEALLKYRKALEEGKMDQARKYAQATSRLTKYMVQDAKRLLSLLGVPWIQAPSEGEAQAAYLVKCGDADYCASQDYDCLLFGASNLARNLTVSGKRKLPGKKIYVNVSPEVINLNAFLKKIEITYEQIVDLGLLLGTDFNPGIKGVGPKTGLKLIRKYGTFEKLLEIHKIPDPVFDYQQVRNLFIQPVILDKYQIVWKEPDVDQMIDFLCGEKDFSEERVRNTLLKMMEKKNKLKRKTTLEKWFS